MHMSAQKTLRSFMQKFPFVRFMFTTNNETSVYTGIRSVCRLIEFPVPAAKLWLPRAQHILHAEGVFLPNANVANILAKTKIDAREVCRVLQDIVVNHRASQPSVQPLPVTTAPVVSAQPASVTPSTANTVPAVTISPAQQTVQPLTPNAAPVANVQPASTAQPTP